MKLKRFVVAYVDLSCDKEISLGIIEACTWYNALMSHMTKVFEKLEPQFMEWLSKTPKTSLGDAQRYFAEDCCDIRILEIDKGTDER